MSTIVKRRRKPQAANKWIWIVTVLVSMLMLVMTILKINRSPAASSKSEARKNIASAKELNVAFIYQTPELINGCEATSLSIVLNFLGYAVGKQEIAYNYMPYALFEYDGSVYHAPDPKEMYAGDPGTSLGFYALNQPVADAANSFLTQSGSADIAANSCDTLSQQMIEASICEGFPVIAWVTVDYSDTATYHEAFTWILPDGEVYVPYSNLHCVVISGYDEEAYTICDPMVGILSVEKDVLLASWDALGNRAVVFQNT